MHLKNVLNKSRNGSGFIRTFFLLVIFILLIGSGGYYILFKPVLPSASLTPQNLESVRHEDQEKDEVPLKLKNSQASEKTFKPENHLKIPKIKVDAALESVGLTTDGAMDVPKNPANVAWFNLGPFPGEIGSSVIAGHFGLFDGLPAVFENLHELRKGDKLSIVNKSGEITTFVVRESRIYDSEVGAGAVFNSSDGKAHLNLITCQGDWDKISKSYAKRLVVFADKEN